MGIERRRAPRYQLTADAEIVSPLSHVLLKARTSDLSLVGCFMNTSYSLPPGTKIQLTLKYEGATFTGIGTVARSEPSMGFGVSFGEVKGAQQTLLRNWLQGLAIS
jgi:PilZ domain